MKKVIITLVFINSISLIGMRKRFTQISHQPKIYSSNPQNVQHITVRPESSIGKTIQLLSTLVSEEQKKQQKLNSAGNQPSKPQDVLSQAIAIVDKVIKKNPAKIDCSKKSKGGYQRHIDSLDPKTKSIALGKHKPKKKRQTKKHNGKWYVGLSYVPTSYSWCY